MQQQVFPIFVPGNKLGIKTDIPEQFLKNAVSPYSRNMEYLNGVLQGRLGLTKFDATALPGTVQLIDQYWKFTGVGYLMVCTTKDICKYDFSSTRFDYLTPVYTTGLITIATGSQTVITGSGTTWNTELAAGDYIKIGTGNVNSDATWYEIDTVDSALQVTLTAAINTGCTLSGYTARKVFQGTTAYPWSATFFVDDNFGDIWIATNGIDTPVRWAGTGQVTPLATMSTGHTLSKYVTTYKDRLVFAWNVEGGANQPQRVRWSNVANCESYDDTDFIDFPENSAWITGMALFSDYLVVMQERGARIGRFVGGDYIFDFESSSVPVGCNSAQSIIATGDWIYYWGIDNMFHRFNILRDEEISSEILDFARDFDPNTEQYIFGWEVEWKNQIRWLVPYGDTDTHNMVVVYDYAEDMVEIWEYEQASALSCIGEFINSSDIYCDDPVWGEYYMDDLENYADERVFLSGSPQLVCGGYDGYVRNMDVGTDDDGTAYTRLFRSKRLDFKMPQIEKRLFRQEMWFDSEPSGDVTLKLKKGDNNDWETTSKSISLINASKDKVKELVTWDKYADNFQIQLESTDHFAFYGFLNYFMAKDKRSV